MSAKLSEIMLASKIINETQLKASLGRQRRFGGRLGSNVLALGYVDEYTLATLLSQQLGVPFIVLSQSAIDLKLLRDFPQDIARRHLAMPFHRDERELFVALADPLSIGVLDELRFVTGARLVEHGVIAGAMAETIEEAYRLAGNSFSSHWQGCDLDPTVSTEELAGHVKIVMGHTDAKDPAEDFDMPKITVGELMDDEVDWVVEEPLPSQKDKLTPQEDLMESILVVDDEPEILNMLTQFFSKCGYRVTSAKDGEEAQNELKRSLPDAIILDAMLPKVHGFELCRQVKNAEATRHIPVVMISAIYRGWRYAQDVHRLYKADGYLEKPLRLDELRRVIEDLLEIRDQPLPAQELTDNAKRALQQAALAYKQGDLRASAKHLESAVQISPFVGQLHHRLGLVYDKLAESHRAIAALERATQLEPIYTHLLILARMYEKTGFSTKAYEAWERCLRTCEDPKAAATIKRHLDKLIL